MTPSSPSQPVTVDGHALTVKHLDKVLFADGTTKAELIHYYAQIAPVLLPHLRGRPITVRRFPDGVDAGGFLQKQAPAGRPDWISTIVVETPGSSSGRDQIDMVVADSAATLVWLADQAAIELHTPQWRDSRAGVDQLVIDLDPGTGAGIAECCAVALLLRPELPPAALTKTSGGKGVQILAPWSGEEESGTWAHELAKRVEREHPHLVLSTMRKKDRDGKVFLDWSQNNPAKTTISAYSVRARERPLVSTPLTWDEVAAGAEGQPLAFDLDDVLGRVEEFGDLLAV